MINLVHSLQSEWIKVRRSLVGWLILGAAFFVPLIVLASRLRRPDQLPALYRTPGFWEKLWTMNWEANSIMILPLTMILVTSLVVQIEYRNNTWKQLHASPQRWITIYVAKLIVVLIVLFQLLALFNLAMLLCGVLPALLFADVALPLAAFPLLAFWDRSARYFVDTLPI
ncbi:MAG: ABC transporter permease, partial [Vicinamibacteria bacterium]